MIIVTSCGIDRLIIGIGSRLPSSYLYRTGTPANTTKFSQHFDHKTAATHLQEYIYIMEQWLHTNRLKASPTKSSPTRITPWKWQYNTQSTVTLNNTPIPYTNTPTTFGVTHNTGMTLKQNTDQINTKAETRLHVVCAPTKTGFVQSKENIARV